VIAIIGVLVALLLPAVQAAREAARRMSCSNNMKQVGLAVHNYHDTYKVFPPHSLDRPPRRNRLAWTVHLLPFMENQPLFDEFDFSRLYNQSPNYNLGLTRVPTYHCPSNKSKRATVGNGGETINGIGTFTTNYYGIMGPKGTNTRTGATYPITSSGPHGRIAEAGFFKQNNSRKFAHITDGTSNCFAIGEISWDDRGGKRSRYRIWTRGHVTNNWSASAKNIANQINSDETAVFNDMSMGSNHPGGAQFIMVDASVQFVSETIDFGTYLAIASIDHGEPVQLP
jgi:hypothetical protein